DPDGLWVERGDTELLPDHRRLIRLGVFDQGLYDQLRVVGLDAVPLVQLHQLAHFVLGGRLDFLELPANLGQLDLRFRAAGNELASTHGERAGERLRHSGDDHRAGVAYFSGYTAHHAERHDEAVERAEHQLAYTTQPFD